MDRVKFNDYDGFVDKFKPKLTTDDCYTPPLVYDAVLWWVMAEYGILEGTRIMRPFKPGGDYKSEDYGGDCCVVDNPPFSILASICRWYQKRGVRFFLFAPQLTLLSPVKPGNGVCAVAANCEVTYANGAKVRTGFVTNLEDGIIARTAPALSKVVAKADAMSRAGNAKTVRKLKLPDEVVTAAQLGNMSSKGVDFRIEVGAACKVTGLDNMEGGIYGGGLLLSKAKAKAKAEAEAKAKAEAKAEAKAKAKAKAYDLSEREREMVRQLGAPMVFANSQVRNTPS